MEVLRHMLPLFVLLFSIVSASLCHSAQSTADVVVSETDKTTLLKEILGERQNEVFRSSPYIIGHGDVITVTIYEEGSMSATSPAAIGIVNQAGSPTISSDPGTKVMMDGRVSLREVGDIEVVGLSLVELADYLKQLYSKIYNDPIVTTTLVQSNSLRYTVMGEVVNPGIFPLEHPTSLIQVIAKAGGFTEWADREILLVRKKLLEGDNDLFYKNTLRFYYKSFLKGKALHKNVFVRSDDIIIVE